MSFRLAIGGISHETNTYAVASSGITHVDRFDIDRGDEILARMQGTRTYTGGFIDAAASLGVDLVPTLFAIAQPSGTIAAEAYEAMRDELVERLRAAGPVDAVALEIHGAGVVEGVDDLESDLARAVRAVVGEGVPLVAALDLHGNITDEMAQLYDLMFGVHLYPHTDCWERGHEAVMSIPALLSGELRPTTHVEHLPILLPTSTTDPGHPACVMNEQCAVVEAREGVVDCTVFHGFPFTDVPSVGVHVVCTTNGDLDAARAGAREVASWIWSHREDFRPETHPPEVAIRLALAQVSEEGPVVINDTADNPGGGSPGDATHVLRAFLEAGLGERGCFGFVCDPEVADQAHAAGVGATIEVKLGGKHDDIHGAPIAATAYVKALTDGRYVLQQMFAGLEISHGRMARLVIDGLDVLVGSRPSQVFDPEVFLLHGIDVRRKQIVGLKSSNHFRAGFRDVAVAIVTADSPGLTTQRVEVFAHERAPRPMWPTDPHASWEVVPS